MKTLLMTLAILAMGQTQSMGGLRNCCRNEYRNSYYYWISYGNPYPRAIYPPTHLDRQRERAIDEEIKRNIAENKKARLKAEWGIRDEAEARREENSALNQKEKRLDNLERAHALKLREEDLIARGIIKKPESTGKKGLVYAGVHFNNLAEFQQSPQFEQMKIEQIGQEARRLAEKEASEQRIKEGYVAEYRRGKFPFARAFDRFEYGLPINEGEPDVYETMRRDRNLVNSPDEFMKKFGTSFSEWLKFRSKLRDDDLGIPTPKIKKK